MKKPRPPSPAPTHAASLLPVALSMATGAASTPQFDTLGKVMERYDQSAKNVIASMRG